MEFKQRAKGVGGLAKILICADPQTQAGLLATLSTQVRHAGICELPAFDLRSSAVALA